uniref:Icosahedral viral capsid protein S domain-containing protein n=1 Tax=Lygus hesperus TaxID=30085 RepID=A0A0K8S3S6_LYGHE
MSKRIEKLEKQMQQLMSRMPAPSQQPKRRRSRRKRRAPGPGQGVSNGELRLSKLELVESIKAVKATGAGSGSVKLVVSGLPFLKKIGDSFERIKWLKCRVLYKPLVGTIRDGGVTLGVDWNFKDVATTRANIACYTPTQSGPVFKEFSLTLPPSRLQSRLWYMASSDDAEGGPAIVAYAVAGCSSTTGDITVGEIWVEYTVVLSGTRA